MVKACNNMTKNKSPFKTLINIITLIHINTVHFLYTVWMTKVILEHMHYAHKSQKMLNQVTDAVF